jgi:hypothetical protein
MSQYPPSQRPAHLRAHAPRTQEQERRDTSGYDLLDDEQVYEPRLPTSTRRYRPTSTNEQQGYTRAVGRQGRRDVIVYHGEVDYAPRRRATSHTQPPRGGDIHPLFWVGLTTFLLGLCYLALTLLGHWWQVSQDDQHYGRPRTFQIDVVVGHNHDSAENPSHFIALNLHRHILVIELPAGDAQHAKEYVGPILLGDGQDLAVVTLSFADVNGDGKPDMLVHVDQTQIVFLNDGNGFRPQRAGEQVSQARAQSTTERM